MSAGSHRQAGLPILDDTGSVVSVEPLRVYLFGGFLLERGGAPLAPIASRAGRSLLAYLVMNRGRPQQRDLLAGSFWPDLPEGKARRRLSQTLWQIQDVVSDGAVSPISVTSDTLAFDTSTPRWLDVEEFDRLYDSSRLAVREAPLDGAALRSCVELYRGDLLAGYFDDWVAVEQDYYRQRYLTALSRLVDATKAAGAYEEALNYARRLTHHDPLSEEAYQEVMRLCFLLERTSEAIQQFERCRSVLAEDLGTEPSQPTMDLYRRIVRQRRMGARPVREGERTVLLGSRSVTPFVGREEERRGLVDALERVLAGPGGVVLMEGEPGVGKTRMALEAADDGQWRGFEVSWGTCAPGALRPYAPLVEVLESLSPLRAEQLSQQVSPAWLGEALRLAPKLGGGVPSSQLPVPLRPAEESTRMREALVHTLAALGRIAPHLIIIDDVHWADQDTLEVLRQLGPRLADSRILLLLLYRSEEGRGDPDVWDVLRDLDRVAGLGRIVLSPLSVFELADVVKRLLGLARLEPGLASHLHRLTGGNVLFTLETLLSLRDQGLLEHDEDPAAVLEQQLTRRTPHIAPRVRSVIDARMSLLGDRVTPVFEAAAVLGDPANLTMLATVADLPRAGVLDAVDELLHRGLINDEGDGRYTISHDQVRQGVYERVRKRRRVELHRRAAEALAETSPAEVEGIGHHFHHGGVPDQAAHYLLDAGLRSLGLHAYATARQHLQRARVAAAEAGWPSEARHGLLAHLETVLDVLGRRDEQREVIEEMAALGGALPATRGDVARRRAWLLAHTGDFAAAERSARAAIRAERRRDDAAALSASLVALGTCLRWSGRPLDAVPHLEAAVEAAGDDMGRRAEASTELGSTLVSVQRSAEALPHLKEARGIFERLEDLRGQAEVAGIQARALHEQGERDAAVQYYQHAIELCRRIGYRHGEGVNLINLSNLHQLMGRVGESLAGYEEGARIFSELANLRVEAMVLANAAAARHTLLGDDEQALADAQRAMDHFEGSGDRAGEAQCLEIMAGVARRRGRHQEAREMLEESLHRLAGTGNRFLEGQHLRSLALLQLDTGGDQEALATLDQADQLCREADLGALAVELRSIRGCAFLGLGDAEAALAHTRQAVEELTPGVERPYLVHHRHALAAHAAGRGEEARCGAVQAHRLLHSALEGLPTAERDRSLEQVPEHREIMETKRRLDHHTVEVKLPVMDAPIGRPLGEDDRRRVTWTINHPEDDMVASPIERRHRQLLRLISEAGDRGASPSMEDLARALEVSESTVRRDLAALRRAGHEVTTRGQQTRAS